MKRTFTVVKKDDFSISRKELVYTLLIACALLLSLFAKAQTMAPGTIKIF